METARQLLEALLKLTPEQLDLPLFTSEGFPLGSPYKTEKTESDDSGYMEDMEEGAPYIRISVRG